MMTFDTDNETFYKILGQERIELFKEFCKENSTLINSNNFDEVYSALSDLSDEEDDWAIIYLFTELLLRSGLDPLPYFTKKIPDYCFKDMDGKRDYKIPEGIEEIGEGAFEGIPEGSKVSLPKSIKYLEISSFADNRDIEIFIDKDSDEIDDMGELEPKYIFNNSTGKLIWKNGLVEDLTEFWG